MLVFCRTIMLNVFIKRFYVNLKEDFIREVRFLDVIKKDTVLFFDMDGTLVDTDYANFLAYQQAISEIVESDLNIEYDSNFRLNRSSLKIFVPFLSETEYCGIIEKKEEAKQLAIEFYGPIFLMYSLYDNKREEDDLAEMLKKHVDRFSKKMDSY